MAYNTIKYYSALKKKEILPFVIYMGLEYIVLIEIIQLQKEKYCVIPLILDIQNCQTHKSRKQSDGYQGLG